MAKQRPTYPDTNLKSNSFLSREELEKWANSKSGTDYIVSIVYDGKYWILFYIEE